MPEALRRRYGGPLEIPVHTDRPTIIANFVASIDAANGSTYEAAVERSPAVEPLVGRVG